MVYVIGIIGFIGGFAVGQALLYVLLRGRSNEELLKNKWLKWQYGIMNWACAAGCCYIFVTMYQLYRQ